jgi:hypothetical protein
MRLLQLASAAVLMAGLAVSSTLPSCSSAGVPLAAPCTASALTASLTNVRGVAAFGCEGQWAYLWANVGTGAQEVSVTELEQFSGATGRWQPVSRAQYCHGSMLASFIYRRACFSN